MSDNLKSWHSAEGQYYEVLEGLNGNLLLYRFKRPGEPYFAGTYKSIAEIEDRFSITLEED